MDNQHTFEHTTKFLNHIFMKPLYSALHLTFVVLFLTALTANAQEQKSDKEYKLWPNGAPGSNPKNWPEPNYKETWPRKDTTVTHVTDPTIRVYRPAKEKTPE
jgi:hypothetical protein